jgi:hypothetical protein
VYSHSTPESIALFERSSAIAFAGSECDLNLLPRIAGHPEHWNAQALFFR